MGIRSTHTFVDVEPGDTAFATDGGPAERWVEHLTRILDETARPAMAIEVVLFASETGGRTISPTDQQHRAAELVTKLLQPYRHVILHPPGRAA